MQIPYMKNNLRYFRELDGRSQQALADQVGTSQPTIARTEKQENQSLPLLEKCAEALGISLASLLAENPSPLLDQVLRAVAHIPVEKHDAVLAALRLAQAQPREEPTESS